MAVMVLDQHVEDQILAERRRTGADRFDEVWNGVYIVGPLADNQHQSLGVRFGTMLSMVLGFDLENAVFVGCNVTDQATDWTQNYRCPDVAIFLPGTKAKNRDTHWFGGPDFAVEIVSPGDRSREKLDFYSHIGVRELLLVGRDPWSLELYRNRSGKFRLVGESSGKSSATLASKVLPVSFQLVAAKPRPKIEIVHQDGQQQWRV